jgi:hypothetical protein
MPCPLPEQPATVGRARVRLLPLVACPVPPQQLTGHRDGGGASAGDRHGR